MKTQLLIWVFVFFYKINSAQIIHETDYPNGNLRLVEFKYAGQKFFFQPNDSTIELYNLNHTLYTSFSIPILHLSTYLSYVWVSYLSETLFDLDSTTIEYLVRITERDSLFNYHDHIHVYNESGTQLFFLDSATHWDITAAYQWGFIDQPVFNTDSGAKMMLNHSDGNTIGYKMVFSLPGKLYTGCCCNGSFLNRVNEINGDEGFRLTNYPNPNSGKSTIEYELPKGVHQALLKLFSSSGNELKSYKITDAFKNISLDNSGLFPGVYYYRVLLPDGFCLSKKMVIIR